MTRIPLMPKATAVWLVDNTSLSFEQVAEFCGLHALEVKNAAQVRPEHLRGLKSFGEDFPESHRWLLYRGRERFLRDGILCVPCAEFLLELKPNHFPS